MENKINIHFGRTHTDGLVFDTILLTLYRLTNSAIYSQGIANDTLAFRISLQQNDHVLGAEHDVARALPIADNGGDDA